MTAIFSDEMLIELANLARVLSEEIDKRPNCPTNRRYWVDTYFHKNRASTQHASPSNREPLRKKEVLFFQLT